MAKVANITGGEKQKKPSFLFLSITVIVT